MGNWIGDDGACALGEVMKVNSTVTTIDMGGNDDRRGMLGMICCSTISNGCWMCVR